MQERSCTMPGCGKPHRARGLCSTHYNRANAKPAVMTCASCGVGVQKGQRYSRRVVCSLLCRTYLQHGATRCPVPTSHASRRPMFCATLERQIPKPAAYDCAWCGSAFSRHQRGSDRYCSMDCRRRAKVVRRKGREADGHTYSWSHVMRVLLLLDGRCAYCEQPVVGPPDPDHVVPLSRGGSNGNANILPTCRPCNSDKRDLLLHEWSIDRAARGKPPVRTVFDRTLPAFAHLLPDALASGHAA